MTSKTKKDLVRKAVARQKKAATNLSDAIAGFAEPGFQEHRSAAALAEYLADRGFGVDFPWRHLPTAFKATRGKGRPSIGMLAEYDALPNCGPADGEWGHGCGHNLLGAAAAAGAVAAADILEAKGLPGKVVMWGCPAEEILAGKVYMARDGAFRGNDAIIAWHPWTQNKVSRKGGSAIDSMLLEFHGKTAHGASAFKGRSALDGVMLLDVAANYLREHVPENVRIHMCILDGGDAPNVVPGYAKCWYYVRGKDRDEVDDVRERLVAAARGAAMATGTRLKATRLAGIHQRLENDTMGDLLLENLQLFKPPRATKDDVRRARQAGIEKPEFDATVQTEVDAQGRGSTDEDSVSHLAPLGTFHIVCLAKQTTGHHREYAAQMALPFAHRGMLRAAEVFAGAAVDLCTKKSLLDKAKAEFRKRRGGKKYDPLVPKRQKVPSVSP